MPSSLSILPGSSLSRLLLAGLLFAAGGAYAGEAGRIVYVSGEAHSGARVLAVGDAVAEGDELATGKQGFVYVRTIDGGLLILRPASRARIVDYKVDSKNPANTKVKMELLSGVARSVSGDAVKHARQNFRFNTPVAAIGVRGTDFTVYTDQETSRVTVLSGAIVVSGFSGNCMPGGSGPCEHPASRELAAAQAGQMLQIQRGQPAPQLVEAGPLKPDAVSPPRPDEPVVKAGTATPVASGTAVNLVSGTLTPGGELTLDPKKADTLSQWTRPQSQQPGDGPSIAPEVIPRSEVVWGRWQAVLDKPASVDVDGLVAGGAEFVARNSFYTLYRLPGERTPLPEQGTMGFALRGSEAVVLNEASGATSAATLENGKLMVNFDKSTFATSFDLLTGSERFKMNAEGRMERDGTVKSGQFSYPSNMNVDGVVSGNGTAAYIFSRRLDEQRVASGVTQWNKK